MNTPDLFDHTTEPSTLHLAPGAMYLRGFALPYVDEILPTIRSLEGERSFRNMVTPGGFEMSVAMTNVGRLGWVTDRRGYRYTGTNPVSGKPWPSMPPAFDRLARDAATAAGFAGFEPDACLVNQYLPGNRLTLHQDKNEIDFSAPIVSVSLGVPAIFLFGGNRRSEPITKIRLTHGDVVVWGGESRLRYHGVMPLKEDSHPIFGSRRINLTFRKAG